MSELKSKKEGARANSSRLASLTLPSIGYFFSRVNNLHNSGIVGKHDTRTTERVCRSGETLESDSGVKGRRRAADYRAEQNWDGVKII